MQTPLTIAEKIVSSLLLIIGILFTYQAIAGYIESYIIYYVGPDSYRVFRTTYISNLLVGNLLIISSLFFFKRKSLGALLYQFTAIMVMLYAINLDFFDMIAYTDFRWSSMSFGAFVLLPFGIFLYFYFKKKNDRYKNKFIIPAFIIIGIITFIYIDLFFCDWYYYFYEKK